MKCLFLTVILGWVSMSFSSSNYYLQSDNKEETYTFKRKTDSPSNTTTSQTEGIRVIEGKVSGRIVLALKIKRSNDPSAAVESAHYLFMNGEIVETIDERGVKVNGDVMLVSALSTSQAKQPIDDMQAMKFEAEAMAKGEKIEGSKGSEGWIFTRSKASSDKYISFPILGELRFDPKTNDFQFIPAIEIITDKGIVKIPVKQIVKFKEQPDGQKK